MNTRIRDVLITILAVVPLTLLGVLLWRGAMPDSLSTGVSGGSSVEALVTRMDALEQRNSELRQTLESADERIVTMERVFEATGIQLDATLSQIERLETSLTSAQGSLSSFENTLGTTRQRLDELVDETDAERAVPALEDFIRIVEGPINGLAGPHIVFQGVNVHVISGGAATDDFGGSLLGLGNLVIGYNEPDPETPRARTGSHNLIIGDGHGFTSYGGLVAGYGNTVAAPSATVGGGTSNVAAGFASFVSGGDGNTADGGNSSIVGGIENVASGAFANVTGGERNRAEGESSSINGGAGNRTRPRLTAIFGGLNRNLDNLGAGWCSIGVTPSPQ